MAIEVITLIDPGGNGLLNNSDRYWLIFDVAVNALNTSVVLGETVLSNVGVMRDQAGNMLGALIFEALVSNQTSATSGLYAFTQYAYRNRCMLVPPGYQFGNFVRCLAYQGTLEELSPLMHV